MQNGIQKLPLREKIGYSVDYAAANFHLLGDGEINIGNELQHKLTLKNTQA